MAQISMKQLADMAGVDVSTVSRALRGDTKRVAAATIERVQKLAQEQGYVADPVAATLRSGRSRMIGVLVPTLTDIVMGHLVMAIDEASQEMGYLSMVVATQGSPEASRRAVDRLLSRRVDGLILCDSRVGCPVPAKLRGGDVPYVFAMRAGEDAISVTADDEAGGSLVAEHFLEDGHDRIAVVPGPRDVRTAIDRVAGFTSALSGHRNVTLLPLGAHAGYGVADGYQSTQKLLRRRLRPTAIFCANDHAAIGAGRAIVEAGLRIGEDVALVGYNDIPQAAYLETPLSSVRTDLNLMGRTAARQLVALLDGAEVSSSQLAPTLIKRASSALEELQPVGMAQA